jgi:hypothetical protein
MNYSLEDIKSAYKEYRKARVFSILKGGIWEDTPLIGNEKPPAKIDGSAAKIHNLKDVLDFPQYLEEYWTRK